MAEDGRTNRVDAVTVRRGLAWLSLDRAPGPDAPLVRLVIYRLRFPLLAVMVLFGAATVAYVAVEGYGWLDAAYMTVITLSTVGFSEVHPLDRAGEVLTMFVIVTGFATFVYAASALTNLFTSGDATRHVARRRERRTRMELASHVIVVGFGRVGQAVVRGLRDLGQPCLVMDRNEYQQDAIRAAGAVAYVGDATNEEHLREAGIERAVALVAAAEEDDTNLIIVLTARAICPELRIVSRVNEASWLDRIKRAGADVAQSPYRSYGMSLAGSAVFPAILDLHDLPLLGLGTEEIVVSHDSQLAGQTLREVFDRHPGVFVVGLRRDQRLHRWHDIEGPIRPDDIVVCLGAPEHLRLLAQASAGGGSITE